MELSCGEGSRVKKESSNVECQGLLLQDSVMDASMKEEINQLEAEIDISRINFLPSEGIKPELEVDTSDEQNVKAEVSIKSEPVQFDEGSGKNLDDHGLELGCRLEDHKLDGEIAGNNLGGVAQHNLFGDLDLDVGIKHVQHNLFGDLDLDVGIKCEAVDNNVDEFAENVVFNKDVDQSADIVGLDIRNVDDFEDNVDASEKLDDSEDNISEYEIGPDGEVYFQNKNQDDSDNDLSSLGDSDFIKEEHLDEELDNDPEGNREMERDKGRQSNVRSGKRASLDLGNDSDASSECSNDDGYIRFDEPTEIINISDTESVEEGDEEKLRRKQERAEAILRGKVQVLSFEQVDYLKARLPKSRPLMEILNITEIGLSNGGRRYRITYERGIAAENVVGDEHFSFILQCDNIVKQVRKSHGLLKLGEGAEAPYSGIMEVKPLSTEPIQVVYVWRPHESGSELHILAYQGLNHKVLMPECNFLSLRKKSMNEQLLFNEDQVMRSEVSSVVKLAMLEVISQVFNKYQNDSGCQNTIDIVKPPKMMKFGNHWSKNKVADIMKQPYSIKKIPLKSSELTPRKPIKLIRPVKLKKLKQESRHGKLTKKCPAPAATTEFEVGQGSCAKNGLSIADTRKDPCSDAHGETLSDVNGASSNPSRLTKHLTAILKQADCKIAPSSMALLEDVQPMKINATDRKLLDILPTVVGFLGGNTKVTSVTKNARQVMRKIAKRGNSQVKPRQRRPRKQKLIERQEFTPKIVDVHSRNLSQYSGDNLWEKITHKWSSHGEPYSKSGDQSPSLSMSKTLSPGEPYSKSGDQSPSLSTSKTLSPGEPFSKSGDQRPTEDVEAWFQSPSLSTSEKLWNSIVSRRPDLSKDISKGISNAPRSKEGPGLRIVEAHSEPNTAEDLWDTMIATPSKSQLNPVVKVEPQNPYSHTETENAHPVSLIKVEPTSACSPKPGSDSESDTEGLLLRGDNVPPAEDTPNAASYLQLTNLKTAMSGFSGGATQINVSGGATPINVSSPKIISLNTALASTLVDNTRNIASGAKVISLNPALASSLADNICNITSGTKVISLNPALASFTHAQPINIHIPLPEKPVKKKFFKSSRDPKSKFDSGRFVKSHIEKGAKQFDVPGVDETEEGKEMKNPNAKYRTRFMPNLCRWKTYQYSLPSGGGIIKKVGIVKEVESVSCPTRNACSVCGFSCKYSAALRNHMKMHTKFRCTICEVDFPTKKIYTTHMDVFHSYLSEKRTVQPKLPEAVKSKYENLERYFSYVDKEDSAEPNNSQLWDQCYKDNGMVGSTTKTEADDNVSVQSEDSDVQDPDVFGPLSNMDGPNEDEWAKIINK